MILEAGNELRQAKWLSAFESNLGSLYSLALVLTADPLLAERCLADGFFRAYCEETQRTTPVAVRLRQSVIFCALEIIRASGGTHPAASETPRVGCAEVEALMKLGTGARVPFVLGACEKISPAAIAQLLAWAPGKVKDAIADAATQLTEFLQAPGSLRARAAAHP